MPSLIQFGPRANAEIQRAFQLNLGNAQVFAVVRRKYVYAQSRFDGDLDKAIESFKKAFALDPRNDEDVVWLATRIRLKRGSMPLLISSAHPAFCGDESNIPRGSQARRRPSRNRCSIALRASVSATRKCSCALSFLPSCNSISPSAAK